MHPEVVPRAQMGILGLRGEGQGLGSPTTALSNSKRPTGLPPCQAQRRQDSAPVAQHAGAEDWHPGPGLPSVPLPLLERIYEGLTPPSSAPHPYATKALCWDLGRGPERGAQSLSPSLSSQCSHFRIGKLSTGSGHLRSCLSLSKHHRGAMCRGSCSLDNAPPFLPQAPFQRLGPKSPKALTAQEVPWKQEVWAKSLAWRQLPWVQIPALPFALG